MLIALVLTLNYQHAGIVDGVGIIVATVKMLLWNVPVALVLSLLTVSTLHAANITDSN